MGYANPEQKSAGIHQRQFCRAFVIGDSNKRVAFVSADAGMISQLVKIEVKCLITVDIIFRNYRTLTLWLL